MRRYTKYTRITVFSGMALLFTIISSCSDDEPLLDTTPKITLKEITPTTVVQFTDSISLVIEYEDGDGDVGFWNPDSLALTVHDLRLANPDYFYVRPLTPDSNALAITGTIRIAIRNTFLLGNGDSETTRYEIKLKDRAGHWSNVVTTPEVVITR
ncbi:MAG: hypothetical protein SH857_06625 [Chitinophagales bacterium]|nr:hypothetical protein [Chitinophagales bacterium]